MILLPVLAGETVLAPGDGGVDLAHRLAASLVRRQHRLERGDGGVETLRDLVVGRFQPARTRGLAVERSGEPAAVGSEVVQLLRERFLVLVAVAPPLDGET